MVAATLAAAGLEFGGNMMASNAGVSRRTVRRRGLHSLEQARSRDALFGGLEESALLVGQGQERQGFKGARSALELGGAVAKQGIQQRGAQNLAAREQSIVSSGLLGTSTGAQQFAGTQDTTSQQLAAIDAQLAAQIADLGLEEGALLGQQGRERAMMAGRRRDFERSISEGAFGLYTLA
jgi:hypothetical protein